MATKHYNDMYRAFSDLKAPSIDMSGLLNVSRRNAETASALSQLLIEGAQAVARRQTEIMQSGVENLLHATRSILTSTSPETNTQKQADLARTLYDSCVSGTREISEMISKSGKDAFDLMNARTAQSIEELTKLGKVA